MTTTAPHVLAGQGRAWCLPADVDTDQLAPGHAMKHGLEVIARHCLEPLRPDFAAGVRPGDVIVAGANFGLGSSREQAASVLVHLGVAAVIAPSFNGLYFRNAFNVGLLLLPCDGPPPVVDGDTVSFDALAGWVAGPDGVRRPIQPIPDFLLEMVRAGGLLAQLKQRRHAPAPGGAPR
ncbi:MAG: 3-isopropylmalate dehydratase [Ideonella sp.]|nr:3-isopropylmalate dehydratase [Ideonella sp.]